MSVKGDAFSRHPSNFDMRMILCVLRCCICFADDILLKTDILGFLELEDKF